MSKALLLGPDGVSVLVQAVVVSASGKLHHTPCHSAYVSVSVK